MNARTDGSVPLRVPTVATAILGPSPAWLWDVAEGRILLASAAGIQFLGESSLAALSGRRFDRRRTPLAQLERLAPSLPEDGSPRLSLVRFFVGFRDVAVPCQCARPVAGEDRTVLVVAGVEATAEPLAARCAAVLTDLPVPAAVFGPCGEIYRNRAAGGIALDAGTGLPAVDIELPEGRVSLFVGAAEVVAPPMPAADQAEAGTASGEPGAEPTTPETATAPAGTAARSLPDIRRFTFVIDADKRFVEVGAGFAALVGPGAADVAGRTWQEVREAARLDPEERLAAALETRDTWSDVRLTWPTDFGDAVELKLSALPRFGEGRAFAGFRGFADALSIVATGSDEPAVAPSPSVGEAPRDEEPADIEQTEPVDRTDKPAEAHVEEAEPADVETVAAGGSSADTYEAGDIASEQDIDSTKVFRLHPRRAPAAEGGALNDQERTAFQAIADALGTRWRRTAEEPAERAEAEQVVAGPAPFAEVSAPEAALADAAAGEPAIAPVQEAETPAVEPMHGLMLDVLDRVPLGLAVVREERVIAANRAFLELFDYPDIAALEADGGIGALLEGRDVVDAGAGTAVFARRRDGSRFAIEARLGRTPWHDGPAMMMSARAVAPAEEETGEALEAEADEQLRDSATVAVLRAVIDTALDGVVTLDGDGAILSANLGASKLFGLDAASCEGRRFVDLVAPGDRSAVADRLEVARTGVVPIALQRGLEIEVPTAAGEPIPAMLTVARLGSEEPVRLCAVMRDLREWKAIEADLVAARRRAEEASAQKSEFLAKMSHEIRTPLNGIIGFSEVILEERFGPLGNDRYREYLKDIRQSGEHLMSLVNDLLDLSKVEAGRLELSFTGVRLGDLVEQSVAIMQPQSSRARVIIRTSLGRGVPAVVADARSIRQVLLNLLSNAIKFTPPGGQVIVSTALGETGEVFLRVRDTGPGMSESDVLTALEPFRQLSVTPSTGERGSGLGLPLAKALVEANRATFTVHSKPGEGTLVEVAFPQARVLAE